MWCTRTFAAVVIAFSLIPNAHASDAKNSARTPVLIELFTSEGCSSCPPADNLLAQWDTSQPLPGAELIVLSEHVDYWNHDGWKDPYSSALLTERQAAYCRAFGIDDPYTPQMIADGIAVLRLTDPKQIGQTLQKDAKASKVGIRIDSLSVSDNVLRGRIETDQKPEKKADVYVAVALNSAQSQVLHGENAGRHLTHVAVLEYLKKIAGLESGSAGHAFEVKLKREIDPANIRVIAFVQEPGPGKVLGAALRKPPFN
ncbi:MAG: DUF1223 domain-containing protein [Acidobacteriaceae bacterium]|nr:DUF1223 domain-containing protein [Acidobacteriaceae bacterium]MBV9503284.1 DUF1223 domain-containing protein [Acidobacteriaceae bacterium]